MGVSTLHFAERELACPCCGTNQMDAKFMEKVEWLRTSFGKPLIKSSAYRCSSYNRQVSTTGLLGPHTTGCAIDFFICGEDAFRLLNIAIILGFTGIGINQKGPMEQRFLHFDDLPNSVNTPRPRIWSYK